MMSASLPECLPPLRQELRLHEAPAAENGAPRWTLEDPVRGQFFQLGWLETEFLAHWQSSAEELLKRICQTTTLSPNATQLGAFIRFLQHNQLVQAECEQLIEQDKQRRSAQKWWQWLFQRHLSFRVPLCSPDAWLTKGLPWVRPLLSRQFIQLSALVGLMGLWLASHQWQEFSAGFSYLFSFSGIVLSVTTVIVVKVLHELGHAFVCKKYHGRVATMGVNFILFWPVLYTDVTTAWRLKQQRPRMLISAAGMLTEAVIAAWALLLWNFFDPGIARSVLLTLATTSLLLSLSVNLSPLMRFDGYFIFSDWLEMPNLQQRASKMAQWKIRSWLWGWQDAAPEPMRKARQRLVINYAFAMWLYRLTLYFGIALGIYHLVFKALGVVLFMVEIAYLLVRPCVYEIRYWLSQKQKMTFNLNTKLTLITSLLLLIGLIVPWHQTISAPAMWLAKQQTLFVAQDAQLQTIEIQSGQQVQAGEVLFRLSSPLLLQSITELTYRQQSLLKQLQSYPFDKKASADLAIIRDELVVITQRLAQQQTLLDELTVRAPFAGQIVDVNPYLQAGDWLATGQVLATLISNQESRVDAYIDEHQYARLNAGATAVFVAENLNQPPVALLLSKLSLGTIDNLSAHPELSSPYLGPIAATIDRKTHQPIPEQALYLATLQVQDTNAPAFQMRGQVTIEGEGQSILSRVWQAIMKVLIRESVM